VKRKEKGARKELSERPIENFHAAADVGPAMP
jgi:hypothetical protein